MHIVPRLEIQIVDLVDIPKESTILPTHATIAVDDQRSNGLNHNYDIWLQDLTSIVTK